MRSRKLAQKTELAEEFVANYKMFAEYNRQLMLSINEYRQQLRELYQNEFAERNERRRTALEFEAETLEIVKKRLAEIGDGNKGYIALGTTMIAAIQAIWVESIRRGRRKRRPAGKLIEAEVSSPDRGQQLLQELTSLANPLTFQKILEDPEERDKFVKKLEGLTKAASGGAAEGASSPEANEIKKVEP